MQHSPNEIKDKLVQALDEENNVVDMAAVIEVVTILEKMPITKDELERTRLGKYVNELRKRTTNESLAKRAKDLVRKWRKLIVPHDTGSILNGERQPPSATVNIHGPSPAHLPGPGPGSIWNALACASKPASPATVASLGNGRPLFRGKSSSPGASFHPHGHHRVASPAFLQCSSASTSPALVRVNNHSRPATPNAVGRPRGGGVGGGGGSGGPGSQYSSPTAEAGDRRAVHEFKPVSPACNSLAIRTGAYSGAHARSPKLPSGMTVARDFVNKSSQLACSSTPVSPQGPHQHHHVDNHVVPKRARPSSLFEDSNSCCSPPFPPPAAQPAGPASALANGVDCGDSMDSVPSLTGNESVSAPHTSRSAPHPAKKRNPRIHHQSEHCDVLKEKIASHLRTPKVKTTAELIEELKARNSGTAPLLEDTATEAARLPSPCPVVRSSSSRQKKPASPAQTSRRPVLPGGDEDMARTKTELMEKFLTDTRHRAPSPGDGKDPVDVILESLPPVNAEDARWESEEEEEREIVERPVTEEVVQRLHGSSWEGVNGHYDSLGKFQAWNELLEKETLNGEMLRILPYVDID